MRRLLVHVTVITILLPLTSVGAENLVFEDFDTVEAWQGFELDDAVAHSGATSARWSNHPDRPAVSSTQIPHDWSGWNALSFWVHNERVVPTAFMCIISSETPATDGPAYWSVTVPAGIRSSLFASPQSAGITPRTRRRWFTSTGLSCATTWAVRGRS